MVNQRLFGVIVPQLIINLIFDAQVALNEKNIFTLNGHDVLCLFWANHVC